MTERCPVDGTTLRPNPGMHWPFKACHKCKTLWDKNQITQARATRDREIAEAVRPLRSALEWCAEQVFEGCDIDGGDFQDEMVQRGIMVSEPASDDFKAEFDANEWFVLAWKARAK